MSAKEMPELEGEWGSREIGGMGLESRGVRRLTGGTLAGIANRQTLLALLCGSTLIRGTIIRAVL